MIRATCKLCDKKNCMYNSGDGEWICEGGCDEVYSERSIPLHLVEVVE